MIVTGEAGGSPVAGSSASRLWVVPTASRSRAISVSRASRSFVRAPILRWAWPIPAIEVEPIPGRPPLAPPWLATIAEISNSTCWRRERAAWRAWTCAARRPAGVPGSPAGAAAGSPDDGAARSVVLPEEGPCRSRVWPIPSFRGGWRVVSSSPSSASGPADASITRPWPERESRPLRPSCQARAGPRVSGGQTLSGRTTRQAVWRGAALSGSSSSAAVRS